MSGQTFVIRDLSDRDRVNQELSRRRAQFPLTVEIKPYRKGRSAAQNRLYFKWLGEIADHIEASTGERYSTDDLHEFFRDLYLPQKVIDLAGEVRKARKSSAKLTVAEFSEYLERIEHYATDSLFCRLTHPEDIYWQALMKEEASDAAA